MDHISQPGHIGTRKFVVAIAVVATMAVTEVLVGIANHSLALVSDATHLTTDIGTLILTSWALRRAHRPANAGNTFGYLRSGILTTSVNALLLLGIAASIAYAAIGRFQHPVAVTAGPVLAVACVALLVNVGLARFLSGHHELSVQSAVWHFLADALASASVIGGSVVILATGWHAVDPVVSLVISVLIALGGVVLLREALEILHESTPRDIDAEDVRAVIAQAQGVEDVHDLHVWSLDRRHRAMSAHVTIADMSLAEVTDRLRSIEVELCAKFGIEHATIQPESSNCVAKPGTYCVIDERHDLHVAGAPLLQEK